LPPDQHLDIGCALQYGAFESVGSSICITPAAESLIFFIIRLLERLREMGNAPAVDLMQYARSLQSFAVEAPSARSPWRPSHPIKKNAVP